MCVGKPSSDDASDVVEVHYEKTDDAKKLEAMENSTSGNNNSSQSHIAFAPVTATKVASNSSSSSPKSSDELLAEILLVLKKIESNTKNKRESDSDPELSPEWMQIVCAIDRLSFCICLALFLANNLFLFLSWLSS